MILLSGSHAFAAHWLFYQDFLDIFNENNPRYAQMIGSCRTCSLLFVFDCC
jgi:hypothetical protein